MTSHWNRALRHTAAAAVATFMIGCAFVWAQRPQGIVDAKLLSGSVVELTKNDHGDPDGWKLDSSEVVHVPPHAFAVLADQVKPGAKVTATVVVNQSPDGDNVNEALVVEVADHRFAITPPVPKSPPDKPAPQTTKKIQ